MKFKDIELLNENVLNSLNQMGFTNPTPIQEKTIRYALEGKDVIGQAETGTGKTGAFVIPIVNMINEESASFEHLIVAPTRELATQIYQEIKKIGHYSYVRVCLILGGVAYQKQRKALNEKPHIVVATPGRLNEYLKNDQIHFDHLKTFTLDEVDELLNIGFQREIESIISYLPKDRQNFFFSATFNERTKKLSDTIVNNEKLKSASVSTGLKTTKTIRQEYIVVKEKHKWSTLVQLLEFYKPQSAIIFGRTKKRIDELNEALNDCGFSSSAIQGDLKQRERHFVLERFRNQQKKILVATDVMARGIDVSHVEWIINFDLPQEIESYTHRIGRTGRAGKVGYSISLVRPNEIEHIKEIAFQTKSKINEISLPSKEEITQVWKNDTEIKLHEILENDFEKDNEQFHFENELIEKFTHEQLATFVAHFLLQNRYKKVQLTPEPAVVLKGQAKIRLIKNQINKHHQTKQPNHNNNQQNKKNQNHNFANNFNKQFSEKSKSNKHKPFIQKKKYKSIQRQTQHGKSWR